MEPVGSISGLAGNKCRTDGFSAFSLLKRCPCQIFAPCSQQECVGSPSPVVVVFRGLCSRFQFPVEASPGDTSPFQELSLASPGSPCLTWFLVHDFTKGSLAHTAVKHHTFLLGGESMESKQRKKMLVEQALFRVQKACINVKRRMEQP